MNPKFQNNLQIENNTKFKEILQQKKTNLKKKKNLFDDCNFKSPELFIKAHTKKKQIFSGKNAAKNFNKNIKRKNLSRNCFQNKKNLSAKKSVQKLVKQIVTKSKQNSIEKQLSIIKKNMKQRHKIFKQNLESFCNNSQNRYPNTDEVYYGDKNNFSNLKNKKPLQLKKFHSPLKNSLTDLINKSQSSQRKQLTPILNHNYEFENIYKKQLCKKRRSKSLESFSSSIQILKENQDQNSLNQNTKKQNEFKILKLTQNLRQEIFFYNQKYNDDIDFKKQLIEKVQQIQALLESKNLN